MASINELLRLWKLVQLFKKLKEIKVIDVTVTPSRFKIKVSGTNLLKFVLTLLIGAIMILYVSQPPETQKKFVEFVNMIFSDLDANSNTNSNSSNLNNPSNLDDF